MEEVRLNEWWVMLRPGKRVRMGGMLRVLDQMGAAAQARAALDRLQPD